MKTFFIALILGIFVGSIITNYFANPDAYEKLQETKARLFQTEPETEPEVETTPPQPTPNEPAMFQVGSSEFGTEAVEAEAPKTESAKPIPLPPPTKEPAPKPPEPAAPAEPTKSRAEQLIEQGAKQAGEIAETVKEKAAKAAEDAKPIIEEGIDLTIATAIRARYKIERRLDSDAIQISVEDHIVTLSGSVPNENAKRLAIEIAAFTTGVNGVEESLSIAP